MPCENNAAERAIRGAVIMRKNSYANRLEKGAGTQSILMSVMMTIKQRGQSPVETVRKGLKTYIETGTLPTQDQCTASDG